MSDALSQAIFSRGVRVGAFVAAVTLPVYGMEVVMKPTVKRQPHLRFEAVERAGGVARRVGLRVNPYHPVKAAAWYNAWQRGWERG
jgi:hypothetical protein